MVLEQTEIKYKGKVIFERLVMSTKFKRVPKLFTEDEACFLFLTKGAFHFRTPTNFLTFKEGDGMLSKCGNYFIENVRINEKTEHQVISAIGAFFYPTLVKSFFQSDLSIQQFQNNFDTTKISIEPLMKSFIDSINYMLDNPKLADENLIITKLKELLLLLSKSEKASTINEFVNSLFFLMNITSTKSYNKIYIQIFHYPNLHTFVIRVWQLLKESLQYSTKKVQQNVNTTQTDPFPPFQIDPSKTGAGICLF